MKNDLNLFLSDLSRLEEEEYVLQKDEAIMTLFDRYENYNVNIFKLDRYLHGLRLISSKGDFFKYVVKRLVNHDLNTGELRDFFLSGCDDFNFGLALDSQNEGFLELLRDIDCTNSLFRKSVLYAINIEFEKNIENKFEFKYMDFLTIKYNSIDQIKISFQSDKISLYNFINVINPNIIFTCQSYGMYNTDLLSFLIQRHLHGRNLPAHLITQSLITEELILGVKDNCLFDCYQRSRNKGTYGFSNWYEAFEKILSLYALQVGINSHLFIYKHH